ncbi:hypothetical protein LPB41_04145 [Thalassospira sp. MA62]|nr:hypothetical protein [Thalassospira sp. MA62]
MKRILEEISEWKREAADEDIARYFYELDSFKKITDGSRVYVVGRKGTGKTAICKRIESIEDHKTFSTKLSFKEFPFNFLYKLSDSDYTSPSQYISVWKYCIYNSILQMMTRDQSTNSEFKDKLRTIYSEDPNTALRDKMRKWTSKAISASILGFGGGTTKTEDYRDITEYWHEILPLMRQCITYNVNKENIYYILFDELDEDYRNYWQDENRERYIPLLTSLLKAVSSIRHEFPVMNFGIRPVVFLRDDIYEITLDPDKNKWEDLKIELRWGRGDIKQMLAHRISRADSEETSILRYEEAINRICRESLIPLGKAGVSRRISVFDFIEHRTHLRPRDFVAYFRFCAESAIRQRKEKLDAETIKGRQKEFSEHFVQELDNEIRTILPNFRIILDQISSKNKIKFKYSEIEEAIENAEKSSPQKSGMDTLKIISVLFHFSVLGNQGDRAPSNRYTDPIFRYNNRNLVISQRLQLHRGIVASYWRSQ